MYHQYRHIWIWLALLLAASFTSCAELIDFEPPKDEGLNPDLQVSLRRHEVFIMVGDTYEFDFDKPDSLSISYSWSLDPSPDSLSLKFKGNRIQALSEGELLVRVSAQLHGVVNTSPVLSDSCYVHVFSWQADSLFADYPYSMVLYCQVDIDGATLSDNLEMAALSADGEVRGRALWLEDGQKRYICLRIYSNEPYGEPIHLYCYDHTRVQRIPLTDTPLVFDGETHGTLSNLIQLKGSF